MVGPPTPPPTTATELQDQARTTDAAPTASAPTAALGVTLQDSYQLAFPNIANLAVQGQWERLSIDAERCDISAFEERHSTRLMVVLPLALSYLIRDDLAAARFAITRLPSNLASQPLVGKMDTLVTAASERRHALVYSTAGALSTEASGFDPQEHPLGPILVGMVAAFVDAFRRRTFALLSKAYTSLPLDLAQRYLGMSAEELVTVSQTLGWTYDPSMQVFTPKVAAPLIKSSNTSTLSGFDFVASSVAKLEL